MYALIGVAAFVMTVPTVTQVATKLFWQVALELTGELIAIAIASKIGEVKLR